MRNNLFEGRNTEACMRTQNKIFQILIFEREARKSKMVMLILVLCMPVVRSMLT